MRLSYSIRLAALITALALLAIVIPGSATAQADPARTLTIDDNGSVVDLRVDEVLQIELPTDPESGFMWLFVPTETFESADVIVGDVWAISSAAASGIQPGDLIRAVDGETVRSTLDLDAVEEEHAGETVTVTVLRGEEELDLELALDDFDDPGLERPIVTGFMDDMPAADAGFETGDLIVAVDGVDVTSITQLQEYIYAREGEEIIVTVLRASGKTEIPVAPQLDVEGFVRIGVSVSALEYRLGGLGLANLNIESYLGVRPLNALIPAPEGVPARYILRQIAPASYRAAEDDPDVVGYSVWQFEAILVGDARLVLVNLNPEQPPTEDISPDQFFEVFIQVGAAPGPAA